MKKHTYLINILLAAELTAVLLAYILIRTYTPSAVFPKISIPALVLLCAVPLAAEHYLGAPEKREWAATVLLAGLSFTLLFCVSGYRSELSAWMLFSVSSAVFGITTLLYTAIGKRILTGPKSVFSPAVNTFCLYLASQCFRGLI